MDVLNQGNFKILSASAGSGKTYRLTKAYLLLLLRDSAPQNFRNLLAITFTNKAVAAMKNRILQNLFFFASNKSLDQVGPLFGEIARELNLSSATLVERSKKTLKSLLHNYAFFDISTIDGFNYRLIRTFAKDLNISQNFEVELDTEYVLGRAVNRVLEKVGKNERLTDILVDFSLEKIDAGKSWNVAYDLNETGKLIFNENHYHHLKPLSEKTIDDFLRLKKNITDLLYDIEQKMQKAAKASLLLIAQNNLDFSDFARGYLPKFLQQVVNDPMKIDFTANWKNNFEETPLYNKLLDAAKKNRIDELRPKLEQHFTMIKRCFSKASVLGRFKKNIVPLALVAEIQKEINTLKQDDPFLTINEFNELISKEIKKQPIPYIYERMGERYRHYFIDEFQDTSVLQWENLIPLIGHAIESTDEIGQQGSLLVVGDAKQSIYRWRGGEPQQFIQLIYDKENPFTIASQIEQLPKNWRSYDEIINFNNRFFSFISNEIKSEEHRQLYVKGNQQEINDKKGGVVKISFIADDREAGVDPHCKKTLSSIVEIKNQGHQYTDICILVRNKNNEKQLAEYLIENQVSVVSAEGLLLAKNEIVDFLVSFLEFVQRPNEKEHVFSILAFLFNDSSALHDDIIKHWGNLSDYLNTTYGIDIATLRFKGTLNLLETIIEKLDLVSESNAYVIAFLDIVVDYDKNNTDGIHGFLDHWHLNKTKFVLPMPEHIDAVKIMTIHKSKGLEFPFVIFPFADDIINDSRKQNDIWISVEPENHSGFDEMILTNNKHLPYYSTKAAEAHNEENEKSILDDLNVLYVALTRAIKGLYIISSDHGIKSNRLSYASLFAKFLQSQNHVANDSVEITFGKLKKAKNTSQSTEQPIIPHIRSKVLIEDFEIAKQLANKTTVGETIRYGNLIHSLLAEIYDDEDITASIEKHVKHGLLKTTEIGHFENLLLKVVQNENLKRFFAKNIDSKNESEILTDDGTIIRPDKLVFNQGKVSIIDYKTGGRSENHKFQVEQYANALLKMGYVIEQKVLAYIDDEINTLVV